MGGTRCIKYPSSKTNQTRPGAILHGGSMTITNTVDAAQPRAHFQQVDSLSSPHALTLSCSFFPVLPNGILTIITAVRIFNPTTGRNLRSAFDQIIGRGKLAEMNLNGSLRAGGAEHINLWLIMWGSDTPDAEVTVLLCKWSLDQPPPPVFMLERWLQYANSIMSPWHDW